MRDERERLLATLSAALEALRATLPANTEAIVHDLTRPEASVVSIVNGHVSGRQQGDPLLAGPDEDDGFLGLIEGSHPPGSHRVFSGYTTLTATGKPLISSSTLYYDGNGRPMAAFCLNVDMEAVTKIKRELDYLLSSPMTPAEPQSSVNQLSDHAIDELLSRFRATGSESKQDFRMRVVAEAQAMGFFKIKGGVNQIAKALGVTRYTVYNYLDKINVK